MSFLRVALTFSLALTTACGATEHPGAATPTTLVLVHGAFADHHAFDAVRPLFEARGYRVLTPDLPGHGDAPASGPITLDTYVSAIRGVVEAAPGKVVLVGHSMAGMVVSQVAEQVPDRVAEVVYVAAYLPRSGDTLQQLAATDADSLVGANLVLAADYSTASIKPDAVAAAIAADLPPAVQQQIVDGQRPEPLAPFQGAVTLTPANFGRVAKAYLRTTEDRAVTPALQARMLAAYPGIATEAIATAHLPFLARPEELVAKVDALIARAR